MFTKTPQDPHGLSKKDRISRVICLFDNMLIFGRTREETIALWDTVILLLNEHADIEARRKTDSSERKLAPLVFQRLCVKMGK